MSMDHYHYLSTLRSVWESAVASYRGGVNAAGDMFSDEQSAFLHSIGATEQEVFDFVEDYVSGGDPDFDTFAAVTDKRRNYFLQVQNGQHSKHVVQDADLPAKTEELDGIVWLPRIIMKAKAKLKGEMNPNLMFSCGGDRRFLKSANLHAAEFLSLVERNLDDERAIIDYVKKADSAH
jgi:hypothetical protein|tara:strand:+ start:304 stop:837 length:534 start_codon:yes stop_codon:yes gene_type:complete